MVGGLIYTQPAIASQNLVSNVFSEVWYLSGSVHGLGPLNRENSFRYWLQSHVMPHKSRGTLGTDIWTSKSFVQEIVKEEETRIGLEVKTVIMLHGFNIMWADEL